MAETRPEPLRGSSEHPDGTPASPGDAALSAEIRAELEHHLACARAELERAGLSPAAAAAQAEHRLGPRARIESECLLVHRRRTMTRLPVVAALAILSLLLTLALYWTHRSAAEARHAALQALRLAERSRSEAVRESRIHPVWRERALRLAEQSRAEAVRESRVHPIWRERALSPASTPEAVRPPAEAGGNPPGEAEGEQGEPVDPPREDAPAKTPPAAEPRPQPDDPDADLGPRADDSPLALGLRSETSIGSVSPAGRRSRLAPFHG